MTASPRRVMHHIPVPLAYTLGAMRLRIVTADLQPTTDH